ncbi:50S ribosomal protein L23 [Candidatus Uhrbacteria bacterium]|nr:50S ribosomal protein L23 [Candidatus Uhrbacteria bacterium]
MGFFDKKQKASSLVLKDEAAPVTGTTDKKEKPAVRASVKKYRVFEHAILRKPLLTEKNFKMTLADGKYVFEVQRDANKLDIKKAFFNITGVMPKAVNVIRGGGESTRFGKIKGTAKLWKKAIITLKKGEKIDTF